MLVGATLTGYLVARGTAARTPAWVSNQKLQAGRFQLIEHEPTLLPGGFALDTATGELCQTYDDPRQTPDSLFKNIEAYNPAEQVAEVWKLPSCESLRSGYTPGHIYSGMAYLGGDPSSLASWKTPAPLARRAQPSASKP